MSEKSDKIVFEDAFKKLEQIVESLERGEMSLDDSIKRFEEGMTLLKICNTQLDQTELRIKKLIQDSEDQLQLEDFNL